MTRAAAVSKIEAGVKTGVYRHAPKAANQVGNRNQAVHNNPRSNDDRIVSMSAITKP